MQSKRKRRKNVVVSEQIEFEERTKMAFIQLHSIGASNFISVNYCDDGVICVRQNEISKREGYAGGKG